ncbi:hydroxymethylbilane synthase [Oryzihumus leptocrescens]|uniref:Porphobilinogen deaminase n=1 Tax=Oryzihumus leptocrescens TaxID=297536 RepID=A0A542ZN10_9MICO|nr:hydroxymethylbilane synthase [Oryzihumus leptocrescens]TQL61733.1 hydroxymethylbilane synthase [Oryzihumus leptocrescens]
MTRLRLGTRRSALATTQSGWVADQLRALGHEVELVEITTFGDTSTQPLSAIGGTGVFAAAIRQALLAGEVDLAVHSLKDLPVAPEPGLTVAAVTRREDPRDALVARDGLTLGELPAGAVVGTGSPRRAAQIAALGLGLDVRAIRGNVDTRLRLVHDGKVDAVVLAAAGLARLGRLDEVTELLDPLQMLPAPGQGALAVEVRSDDPLATAAVRSLDDADTRASVTAERALLAALEAGCTAPIGALAEVVEGMDGAELSVRAFVGSEDGAGELRRSVTGPVPEAERLGRELAAVLLEDGARHIVTVGLGPAVTEDRPPDPDRAGGHDPQRVANRPHDPADRPDPTAPERAL